jgi:hypothetical protein
MTTIIGTDNLNIPTYGKTLAATVVLTGGTMYKAGYKGDVAAYVGLGEVDWVVKFGRKMNFQEAKAHFPNLKESDYRK